MKQAQKRFQKVVKFYKTLPSELISRALDNLVANRNIRRSLSKIKSNSEKVDYLMNLNLQTRKNFADAIYHVVKENVALTLNTAEYSDVIGAITDENKLYYTIFFFRWCYEDGEDGASNDEKYYAEFVDSPLFNAILEGESVQHICLNRNIDEDARLDEFPSDGIEKDYTQSNDKEEMVVIDKNPVVITNHLKEADNYLEVSKMKLLGHIEKRTNFYNFFPQFELVDGIYEELSVSELKKEYPTSGAINLAYSFSYESGRFLEDEIKANLDKDKEIKSIYLIEIDNYDLEPNSNEAYSVKLNLQKLVKNGHKLNEIIQNANECDVYKVVTCESSSLTHPNFASGNIILKENNIVEHERVVLDYDGKYYGPFTAYCRAIDGKYYIKAGASEKNYLVPFYSEKSINLLEFEKQAYYEEPTFTSFVHIIGECEWYDSITDEMLLEKITDDISLDLAVTKPEEFVHLFYNSPFCAGLSQHIVENRIKRLQTIINNVDRYKEERHRIFESLLQMYQDDTSEVSDKMITDSKLYKVLQTKYNEERKKNEETENQIQELKKEYDELSSQAQVSVLSNVSVSDATSEEISKLKSEIVQLRDELDKKDAVISVSADIEKLKRDQEKLKHNNDFLNDQAREYEKRIESAQDEVRKAIKASAGNMASLAFDPFISSEMLKVAASWDTKSENNEYEKIASKISEIHPSDLNGTDLIDYIVKYVQARREYSRNDIINIYISIAQNVITIFSGEPGTGKTSMGNIISDTLGLMQFGERMNRFVSVSVERGWSSKRDLIGYFNPLTRKYDKSNSKIYDALRILDSEKANSRYPYVIMLDEANLSPIEYYWADFMRLTDRSSVNDRYINIGIDHELFVPETLKFIATINTDQTTEMLSPRLIDRACIIKLPKAKPKTDIPQTSSDVEIITWKNFHETFSKNTDLRPITQRAINEIYDLFNTYGMSVSPRIQLGIEEYVKAAQSIMEDEADVLAREKALDFAIVQKLLPKINGYYANYERFFESLKKLCKEYNLKMTDEALDKIINAQERNMGYCQYLI